MNFVLQSNLTTLYDDICRIKNRLELSHIYDAVIEFVETSCHCLLQDFVVLLGGIGAQVGPLSSVVVLRSGEIYNLSSDLRTTIFDLHIDYDQSVVLPEQSISLPDFLDRFGSIGRGVDL